MHTPDYAIFCIHRQRLSVDETPFPTDYFQENCAESCGVRLPSPNLYPTSPLLPVLSPIQAVQWRNTIYRQFQYQRR